jgi:glycerol uptake facilitator protein
MEAATTTGQGARATWRRTIWGELLSELLGTFVLICFGDGVVAMAVAALNQSGRGTDIFAASGDWLIIGWGWGFAVAFGVYVAGGISGAHINPAVTLAFAARRGFPWRKVPGYIAAQLVGAFLGAVLVYIVYKGAIDSYERAHQITRGDPDSVTTFSIFATFPAKYLGSWLGPFVDQVVGTAFLLAFVFALVDELNQPHPTSNHADARSKSKTDPAGAASWLAEQPPEIRRERGGVQLLERDAYALGPVLVDQHHVG